jgi:uncharacterized YigZ family protein
MATKKIEEAYRTVSSSSWAKIVIKNSRFFSRIFPLKDESDLSDMLQGVRASYKKTTHIVYAYRLFKDGVIQDYCTDAGEPAGSAGQPLLRVLQGKGLANVCLVVVRYFGGTKLGIGGLIKAYTEAAQIAIEQSRLMAKTELTTIKLSVDYNQLEPLLYAIKQKGGKIKSIVYEEKVSITAQVPPSIEDEFIQEFRIMVQTPKRD